MGQSIVRHLTKLRGHSPTTVKVDGKKVHTNLIWGIRFDALNGQKLTDPNLPIISCSHQQTTHFVRFN
jgi:hypothetical protein